MTREVEDATGDWYAPSSSVRASHGWSHSIPDIVIPLSSSARSTPSHQPLGRTPNISHPLVARDIYSVDNVLSTHASGVDASEAHVLADSLKAGSSGLHFREGSGNAKKVKKYPDPDPADEREDEELLVDKRSRSQSPSNAKYSNRLPALRPLWHLTPKPRHPGHNPIPAITVFSRYAAPLHLPLLDGYISSLSIPDFVISAQKIPVNERSMFSPMDRVAATKKSMEDLEANKQVAPAWRNRSAIMGALTGVVLGVLGSSLASMFYSLHTLFNTVQIFALILDTVVPVTSAPAGSWEKLFLGTIPNVIALNFGSTLITNVTLLLFFTSFAGILLFCFHREVKACHRLVCSEGLQRPERTSNWSLTATVFMLTVIYLPLSTVAVHVITWSDELWVVPNPYINGTTSPSNIPSLGPPAEYRDPLDFCWTTTMRKDEINFAPAIIVVAISLFLCLSVWFPFALNKAITHAAPLVDPYTSLGEKRTSSDLNLEYQRVLDRDPSPLSFIYHSFRRGWARYESIYLFAKLSALLIVAVIDPNNCLFRRLPSHSVILVRQTVLLAGTTVFFVIQCYFTPFLDPLSNASEWMSRLNYVLTSLIALLVVLNVPGESVFGGPVLYIVYTITYGFTVYFTVINWSWVQGFVKYYSSRIDFSIDIFSPRIDLTTSSPHIRRRIWQESISALILTSAECRLPQEQTIRFVKATDLEYPPYLLQFTGSPGERHIENIEILREVGSHAYNRASSLAADPEFQRLRDLVRDIEENYVGPDCYWYDPATPSTPGHMRFFGNAWLLPFPPTLIIKYDDGEQVIVREISDLQQYVAQNASNEVRRRREIRLALRALDGQRVFWPHRHTQSRYSRLCCFGFRFQAKSVVSYQAGTLSIGRKGYQLWNGLQLGSGFDINIKYARGVSCSGNTFGVNDNYDLTQDLARFLSLNHQIIQRRLPEVLSKLREYRSHISRELRHKSEVLSYTFLTHVYDRPKDPMDIVKDVITTEKDLRVRQLFASSDKALELTFKRLSAVSVTEVTVWWYLFWDDFWRQNQNTIPSLRTHSTEFNPHFPTSIAYTPLPRPALEAFLMQRGLLGAKPQFLYSGFLNKIYIRLYDIVYHGSRKGEIFHLGSDVFEADLEQINLETQANPSTIGTGNGTDYDDASVRQRPYFRWEGLLNDPVVAQTAKRRNWVSKLGPWLGIAPRWRTGVLSPGVALDVKLENGRYVLI